MARLTSPSPKKHKESLNDLLIEFGKITKKLRESGYDLSKIKFVESYEGIERSEYE